MHLHILLLTRCYFNRKIKILVLTSLISAIPEGQVRACHFLLLEKDRHKVVVLTVRKEKTLNDSNIFFNKFILCYAVSNVISLLLFSPFSCNIKHLLHCFLWVTFAILSDHHFQLPEGCSPITFAVSGVFNKSTAVLEN